MKRMVAWFCLALLCLCLSVPVSAQPLEVERECSLTLHYAKEGVGFAGVEISLYRVAEANPDGTYVLVAPFADYAVSIHDVTDPKGWSDLATTLSGYAVADSLPATRLAHSDQQGQVTVSGLPTGLYLVDGVTVEQESGTYTFDPFMVYLPTQNEGEYQYEVVAKPKADRFTPAPPRTEYRVIKLWEDVEHTQRRPASITAQIYKNGILWNTVTLSQDNNWTYTWTDPDQSEWSVVERNVPEDYTVYVDQKATTFVVTNQWNPDTPTEPPADPPETGDTAPVWLYVLVLCLSGSGCVIVGLALMRGKRYEKRQ
ncbi:MAG: Cna B-type domain-containing protein [Ruminococcaceae bacterium]|nr:Cna B-type domain-containing protein [Oscillospiraceae bacterium]